jgi:hypothetical protein
MNIEDLNKSQLLLLTIMVNFVVSIATGVLTVSMLDRAPANITQTVNKIVDRTVETISAPIQIAASKPTPTTPSSEQLLTSAITADVARTVLIYKGSTTTPAIAYGVYLPKSRAVATAKAVALPKEAIISFANGTVVPASLSRASATVSIYGFADSALLPDAPAAGLTPVAQLKQGQTVITITKDNDAVTGIISKIDAEGIHTTLSGLSPGAAIVDLSGIVVGLGSFTPGVALTSDSVMNLLSASSTSVSVK